MVQTAQHSRRAARRVPRFGLRSMFGLTVLVAIGVAVWIHLWEKSREEKLRDWLWPLVSHEVDAAGQLPLPLKLSETQRTELLVAAGTRTSDRQLRVAALKTIFELYPKERVELLRRFVASDRHADSLSVAIRLLGLNRDPRDLPRLTRLLEHRSGVVRAAAIDAIGIIRRPAFDYGEFGCSTLSRSGYWALCLRDEPLHIWGDDEVGAAFTRPTDTAVGTAACRARIEDLMLRGGSLEEREAAARALLDWPPVAGEFRYAEWGVWLDLQGTLDTTHLEDTPPFVHTLGGNAADLATERTFQSVFAKKPIIQLTSNLPMAVDIDVVLALGRPTFAYPLPDDHSLRLGGFYLGGADEPTAFSATFMSGFDRPGSSWDDAREGYPWLFPQHRVIGRGLTRDVVAMGVRWQSVIVSPERLSWMTAPAVPSDPNFAWWERLRAVPASWVSSRGDSERFLFYDGPTRAATPVRVTIEQERLHVVGQPLLREAIKSRLWQHRDDGWSGDLQGRGYLDLRPYASPESVRDGLFVSVGEKVASRRVALDSDDGWVEIDEASLTTSQAVAERALLDLLIEKGLTAEEAAGLVDSWRGTFFSKPGRRYLAVFGGATYDKLCPLVVRPRPTEIARVGLVLFELDADSANR